MKQFLSKLIGIDIAKNNKVYFISKIIFSMIFAITIALDSMITFSGKIFGTIDQTYMDDVKFENILIFLGTFIATYLVISIIEIIIDKFEKFVYTTKERKEKNIKVFFIIFAVILLCWSPIILTYFPGGIYTDTVTAILQERGAVKLSNHHPILYTFLLGPFLNIDGTIQTGMEVFTVVQVLVKALAISGALYWLYRRNISIKCLAILTFFAGIYRLFPIYAISIWKDTPYSIALFLFALYIANLVYREGKPWQEKFGAALYIVLTLLVCFLRNNGIYIVILTHLILMIFYFKKAKLLSISSVVMFIIVIIVQGPVYNKLGLNINKTVESLGIPLQQVSYVVAHDGVYTPEQGDFIRRILPIERIKEEYRPCIVDKIKWAQGFDTLFLNANSDEFIKIWFNMFFRNPIAYTKAYLLNTLGFWDVNKATFDGQMSFWMWGNSRTIQIMGEVITQTDYIKEWTGITFEDYVLPSKPTSSAIFLFINLFTILITIYKRRYKNLLIYIPAIANWMTIMIAAPLAFTLRYVYILVMMMPLSFAIPFIKTKKEEE